jgi:hypothetical protein
MTNKTDSKNHFARARAYQLAKAKTLSPLLLWAGFEGGDHIFLTPSGREVYVDLVIGKVTFGA